MNALDPLRRAKRFHGGCIAIDDGDRSVTYEGFHDRAMRAGNALRNLGPCIAEGTSARSPLRCTQFAAHPIPLSASIPRLERSPMEHTSRTSRDRKNSSAIHRAGHDQSNRSAADASRIFPMLMRYLSISRTRSPGVCISVMRKNTSPTGMLCECRNRASLAPSPVRQSLRF